MAKEFAKKFYKSKKWRRCRELYILNRTTIDGGLCERCKKDIGYILHHKINLTEENITNPWITLSENNLEWLCHECHNKEDGHFNNSRPKGSREKLKLLCKFDKNGQPISLRDCDIPPIIKDEGPWENHGRGMKKIIHREFYSLPSQ